VRKHSPIFDKRRLTEPEQDARPFSLVLAVIG